MVLSKKSWFYGLIGAVIGCTIFAVDTVVEHLGPHYHNFHVWIEICEFTVIGPGLGALSLLMAERVRALRETTRLLQEIEEQKRFQILGRMAASVAHEVRNPLHTLRLVIDEMRLEDPALKNNPLSKHIDNCIERIDRAVSLVYQLARHKIDDVSHGDMIPMVQEAITLIQQQAIHHHIVCESLPEKALVRAAPEAQRIMIDNLLRNAVEATQPGSAISIDLQENGKHWVLTIRNPGNLQKSTDNLSNDNQQPESTKASGLGLGILITRQLATNVGGSIQLQSKDGTVTATLTLPKEGN